jgi:DnaJ family protein C protein 7
MVFQWGVVILFVLFFSDKAKSLVSIAIQKGDDSQKYQALLKNIKEIDSAKNKANELFKANKLEEAIEAYTTLLDFDLENKMFHAVILSNRALCYHKQKEYLKALTDINTSLVYNPKYTKVQLKY